MGGGLNYDKLNGNTNKPKSTNEKSIVFSKEFPTCKGLYPDCPETPNLLDKKCRNCPKTDDVKKPKVEWIECEFCKEEEAVPVDPKEEIINTKCHFCNKENSSKYIKSKR